jgi:diaminopimelate epimerase
MRYYKYQATGNDFVLVDNRAGNLSFSDQQVSTICDRRFGIGADGLILLEKVANADFRMVYHNRDGSQSFCGNGCRAIAHFAQKLGVVKEKFSFVAHDGLHNGQFLPDGRVRISLADVKNIESKGDDYYINTGTDHHVRFVKNLANYPVFDEGKKVRYSDLYKPKGTNVDFVEVNDDKSVSFRIYERGVEDETFSSGSGATACGLAVAHKFGHPSPINLKARGGELMIEFKNGQNGIFTDIYFTGPVQLVFETESQF